MLRVTENAEPELTVDAATFREHASDGTYWGVPTKYFTVRGSSVYLDGRIAAKLEWNIDAELPTAYNVNTMAQRITIDDETVAINLGSFCSYISKEHVQRA